MGGSVRRNVRRKLMPYDENASRAISVVGSVVGWQRKFWLLAKMSALGR